MDLQDCIQSAIKGQYHAALAMLRQAVEMCPEDLWTAPGQPSAFWHVAYHTLHFTHLYLMPDEASFTPWEHAREEYWCLEELPYPPHRPPKIEEPYTRAQVLEYLALCDGRIDDGVDALDLSAESCGFWWYDMPKLDHQLMNIRHVQHHVGDLAGRLRTVGSACLEWNGRG